MNSKNKKEEIVVESKEIANILNQYFVSIFNKNKVSDISDLHYELDRSIINEPTIIFEEGSIIKTINSFKRNKSPGIDEISSTYALKIKEIIAKPLTCIFNRSFQYNEIPIDWKKGIITPIFKKGSRKSVENYRPVSLTCIFGKIMEKIIKNYLETFLLDKNYINSTQHGFSKGKSCTTNLLIFQDSVLEMLMKIHRWM